MIAIDGAKITIMPKHDDLKDPLEFQSNELKKYFRQVFFPMFALCRNTDTIAG